MAKRKRKYHTVASPTLGLNYEVESTMLDSRATPDCSNVRFVDNYFEKRRGSVYCNGTGSTALKHNIYGVHEVAAGAGPTWANYFVMDGAKGQLAVDTDVVPTEVTVSNTQDPPCPISFAAFNHILYYAGCLSPVIAKPSNYTSLHKYIGTATAGTVDDTYRPCWIAVYGARMNLYGGVTTTTLNRDRVRWSVAGDPEDYSSAGSGYKDIYAALAPGDSILRAEPLGNSMILYGHTSMAIQNYTANATDPFSFKGLVPDMGIANSASLVSINGEYHLFQGRDGNIYRYAGGRAVEKVAPLANKATDYFNPRYTNYYSGFAIHLFEEQKVRFYFTARETGASVYNTDSYFEYDLNTGSLAYGTGAYTCAAHTRLGTTLKWSTVSGSWADLTRSWSKARILPFQEDGIIFGIYGTKVEYYNNTQLSEADGTAIDAYYDTKDFIAKEAYRRNMVYWQELNFEGKGHAVTISYSTDLGRTWTELEEVTLNENDWTRHRLDFEVWSPQIRFKFANSTASETFAVRQYEIGYHEGSDVST